MNQVTEIENVTPEQFVQWVANWVIDGDIINAEDFYAEDEDEGSVYEMENDEVYENYRIIVSTARQIIAQSE